MQILFYKETFIPMSQARGWNPLWNSPLKNTKEKSWCLSISGTFTTTLVHSQAVGFDPLMFHKAGIIYPLSGPQAQPSL